MKICSCKRHFTWRVQNCLLQTGVHGSYFRSLKYPSWLYHVFQSWGFFQYKRKWCLISTDKAKSLWRALPPLEHPQLWCQLSVPSPDTTKIGIFDEGGSYSSPSPSALVAKNSFAENPSAIFACQLVALGGKKETLTRELGFHLACRSPAPRCCFCREQWRPSWQPG